MGFARVGILDGIAQGNYEGAIVILDKLYHNVGELIVFASFYRHGSYQERLDQSSSFIEKETDDLYFQGKQDELTEKKITEAFRALALDKNNYIGAADIRHALLKIGEMPTGEKVK